MSRSPRLLVVAVCLAGWGCQVLDDTLGPTPPEQAVSPPPQVTSLKAPLQDALTRVVPSLQGPGAAGLSDALGQLEGAITSGTPGEVLLAADRARSAVTAYAAASHSGESPDLDVIALAIAASTGG